MFRRTFASAGSLGKRFCPHASHAGASTLTPKVDRETLACRRTRNSTCADAQVAARTGWERSAAISMVYHQRDDFPPINLSQQSQRDLGRPVLPLKNISLPSSGKSTLSARPVSPHQEGRIASRHGRGVGCGGRGSVGHAMNSRADERRRCVRRSRVVLASVADVKPAEVHEPNRVFAEPSIRRRR